MSNETKKLYWNTPRVQQFTRGNILELYNKFIKKVEGFSYPDLKDECQRIYNKPNDKYFGQILTFINFLGLLQTENINGKDIVVKNNFLSKYLKNETFSKQYLEYLLFYWQYPRHNITDNRNDSIRKPYVLVLKLLRLLYEQSADEAYLTKKEFLYLFENNTNPLLSYDNINNTLVTTILKNDRAWGKSQLDYLYDPIGYDIALLNNSSILTTENNKYTKTDKKTFAIGLDKNTSFLSKLDWLLSNKVKKDFFYFNPETSATDKKVIADWANFITNEKRFKRWVTKMNLVELEDYCNKQGFKFDENLLRRFILSLKTKPFLILTGISGSGKTKIAELYGEYLERESIGSLFILPIGSNWNDNKKLLGFKNPLISDKASAYQETDLVKVIKEANINTDKTYLILLDEMNLSYTEKYFADFLSALETRTNEITLPNGEIITWSKNLKIIGTINEDETTHTISPKVLDRANVIEMNGLKPSDYIDSKLEEERFKNLGDKLNNYKELLDEIYECLNGNFAFRVVNEITDYINNNRDYSEELNIDILLDEQIYQKILPKIHGSKMDLPPRLVKLKKVLQGTEHGYDNTITKIDKMLAHVSIHGYASFVNG